MRPPTPADMADLELPPAVFDAAARAILAGARPDAVQDQHGLTEGQLAYVRRYAGELLPLFAPAEQLALVRAASVSAVDERHARRRCDGSGAFVPLRHRGRVAACGVCGGLFAVVTAPDGGPQGVLDDHDGAT